MIQNAISKFTAQAQKATELSSLMEGRQKVSTSDLIASFTDGVTLNRFDILTINGDTFPVFTIAEDEHVYYFGGTVLTKIALSWLEMYEGDISSASEDLESSGGVKVQLEETKTKAGRNITTVKVVG